MSLGEIWGQAYMLNDVVNTGKSASMLSEHLGCPVRRVDAIILQLALQTDKAEWLRGVSRLYELPRFATEAKCAHYVPTNMSFFDWAEVIEWVVDNLKGLWFTNETAFCFNSDYDAVLFRLRWT